MKFLEIEDGLTISIGNIVSFEDYRNRKTRITISGGDEVVVNMPYAQFKLIIAQGTKEESRIPETVPTPVPQPTSWRPTP